MFEMLKKIWQTGQVTKTLPFEEAPERYRGQLLIDPDYCNGCEECVTACPADALSFEKEESHLQLTISFAKCIYCGLCEEVCSARAIRLTNEYLRATKNPKELTQTFKIQEKRIPMTEGGKQ